MAQSRSFNRGSSGEKRFLGVTINLPPKGGYLSSYYYERKTHTVYFTVSSTATVAQFKSCIDKLQFVTSNGRTSTDLCYRRRREVEMTDSLVEATPVLS